MPTTRRPGPPRERRTTDRRTVSWFPGHMHKAQKRLAQEIQHIDVVLEMRDARLPRLSANPELARLAGHRPRLVLLNKASLADPQASKRWQARLEADGLTVLLLDAESRSGLNLLYPPLRSLTAPLEERYKRRGIRPPAQRLLVVGMPNVGKSTFINRLIRHNRLAAAPMPGVTRGVQWVQLGQRYLLMDTPGMMLPRLDKEEEALHLGWIGTIRDSVIGLERLATTLLAYLQRSAPDALRERYGVEAEDTMSAPDLLHLICRKRGFILSGGGLDLNPCCTAILDDFRSGRLGRITLEEPAEE